MKEMTKTQIQERQMAIMSRMLNAPTITLIRYSDTMETKMLMADVPLIHLNMMNIRRARRSMSRMSAKDT